SLYATLLGVALGYLYLRFRKLRLCIAGHMAFNLTAFVIMIIEESGMIVPDWTLIPGIIVFAAGVYLLTKQPPATPIETTEWE
ncbi:MAG: CPBP family intramembrane metalloprotease, partial [Clostridiales bacterium]|nr:CPBP family intramembrane metalloprotease [Clostridiales bacterium]